jgi:predicted MFS family arabinose efflux permease
MAGLIIQVLAWPYAYLMTVAGGLVTLQLARRVNYTQARPPVVPFDYTSAVLVFLAVVLLTTGIMQSTTYGLTSPVILMLVGAGLLAGLGLILVSRRKASPLIQLDLLKIRNVAIAVLITALRVLPNLLMGVFVARYAQQVLGLSPTVTGLLLVLPPLAQVMAAPVAGRMLDGAGPRLPVALGVGLQFAGLLLLAVGFPAQQMGVVLAGAVVGVAGFAFTNPVQIAALNQAPPGRRGMVAGIFPLAGQFGTTLWVALLTAGVSAFMAAYLAANPAAGDAAAQAQALGWLAWISAGLTLIPLAAARLLEKGPAQPA